MALDFNNDFFVVVKAGTIPSKETTLGRAHFDDFGNNASNKFEIEYESDLSLLAEQGANHDSDQLDVYVNTYDFNTGNQNYVKITGVWLMKKPFSPPQLSAENSVMINFDNPQRSDGKVFDIYSRILHVSNPAATTLKLKGLVDFDNLLDDASHTLEISYWGGDALLAETGATTDTDKLEIYFKEGDKEVSVTGIWLSKK